MAAAMQHRDKLAVERTSLPGLFAGRVHLGVFQPAPQPHVDPEGRRHVWLDGEIANGGELARRFSLPEAEAGSDAELVAASETELMHAG